MSDFAESFQQLSAFLRQHKALWAISHFAQPIQSWQQSQPELYQKLLAITDTELSALEQWPQALNQWFMPVLPELSAIESVLQISQIQTSEHFPKRLNTGVPGRKWQQIQAFTAEISKGEYTQTIVDWCAGKSFMGRALAHHWQCGLHAIEYQQALCDQGHQQASQWLTDCTFSRQDVLAHDYDFSAQQTVIALHACGDLHRHLLRQWQRSDSKQLVLAPCCYHKWLKDEYQPLSQMAVKNNLHLMPQQVQLAVQETVTASPREQKQVETMQLYRLVFDELQRDLRGIDEYLPTPSLPYGVLTQGSNGVIQSLADKKSLPLPDTLDLAPYQQKAQQRFAEFKRLQLLSHVFRRPLEMWLLLDQALYLQEAGCSVELQQFCERHITPRNIRIQAWR